LRFVNEMKANKDKQEDWGSWEQAETWPGGSFAQRSHAQRLQWLKSALILAYRSGAIKAGPMPPVPK